MHAGSQNRQFVRPPHEAGFTLIEIVMCLIILGILAAVAVPKYFDLQESGRVTVCQHNRDVIRSTIEKQQALGRFTKDTSIFDESNEASATTSAQHILNDMYPADQKEAACPSGGLVSVRALHHGKDDYTFNVACSIHASDILVVTRDNPLSFLEWFLRVFEGQSLQPGVYEDFSKFFSITGVGAEIDSEAGNFDNTTSKFVAAMLQADGVDTSNVIWRMHKEQWYPNCKGTSCWGKVVLTFADRADVKADNKGHSIEVTQYRVTVKYDANGKPTLVTSDLTHGTATLVWKNEGDPKKNQYWVLDTSKKPST